MTLRMRLAVLTSVAVALAIVVASVSAWLLIRSSLLDEVDERLRERVPAADRIALVAQASPPVGTPGAREGEARVVLQANPIGAQVVDAEGEVTRRLAPGDADVPLSDAELALLDGSSEGEVLRTVELDGESYRVMSVALADGGFLRFVHPLAGVKDTMARIGWLLVTVAGVGVGVAAVLGSVTAQAGLRPVGKLVASAEQVADTKDLAHRIDLGRSERGELARLAGSINEMLAALERARAEQRELIDNAGHELRTPLSVLRSDIGLLLRAEQHPDRPLGDSDRQRLLRDLDDEVSALADLVGEVLDLARGETEPEPVTQFDLRAVVERAVARNRRIDPSVDVAVVGDPVELAGREAALERAIGNLVRNAVQVSPQGGQVDVELGHEANHVTVVVRDRGPGIASEDLPRLFNRFFRGAEARQRHGSGLGLAIVAQVADQHFGTVAAANRDGGGAELTLRLPVELGAAGEHLEPS